MDRKNIVRSPLNKAETDLEDTQVAAVVSIDKMTQTLMDGFAACRDQPGIQAGNRERRRDKCWE